MLRPDIIQIIEDEKIASKNICDDVLKTLKLDGTLIATRNTNKVLLYKLAPLSQNPTLFNSKENWENESLLETQVVNVSIDELTNPETDIYKKFFKDEGETE